MDIRGKLDSALSVRITSEQQAVYILVELRKLVEMNNGKLHYPALMLCCDWAVHPRLSGTPAQAIVGRFDKYEAKYRREHVGVSSSEAPELADFCEHRKFRAEFIGACEAYGVSAAAPQDDAWWQGLLRQFAEVVKDCPLEARGDNTKYVMAVKAFAVDPQSFGIQNCQFGIEWVWQRRDSKTPGSVLALF